MKQNLLLLHPPHVGDASRINRLADSLAEKYFVYLWRPCSAEIDDSPSGVRTLNHELSSPPSFGELAGVCLVEEDTFLPQISDHFSIADHFMVIESTTSPEDLSRRLKKGPNEKILRPQFGKEEGKRLAKVV